jgi:hypothetical protein
MKTNTKFPKSSVKGSSAIRLGARALQVLGVACEERSIRVGLGARALLMKPSAFVPVVNRLERLGLVTVRHEAAFLLPEEVVRELEEERRIDLNRRWVTPTRSGLRLDGRGYSFYVPVVAQLEHMAWVAGVRATCAGTDPDAVWVPERLLSKECARSQDHLADGALLFKDGLVPVEAERTRKDVYRIVENMASLVERFGGARYYCSSESRPGVERARQIGGFEDKVEVFGAPVLV